MLTGYTHWGDADCVKLKSRGKFHCSVIWTEPPRNKWVLKQHMLPSKLRRNVFVVNLPFYGNNFQKPQSRIEENVKSKSETWGIVIIQKDLQRSGLGKKGELRLLITKVN